MLTQSLERVIRRIEQLPASEQDALAESIERELEEREWEALLARPESAEFLGRLASEAREEHAAGRTESLPSSARGHLSTVCVLRCAGRSRTR
jgi:acetylornithine deacetylase/succinyl-diaminopimelate desuccinylase-like protein